MGNRYSSKDSFYARLRQLSDIKNTINENKNSGLGTLIDYKRGADKVAYGIIKENHKYYIKKSNNQKDPNIADFAYIGGLENIKEYEYKSLSEADKQLNLLLLNINEVWDNDKKPLNEDIEDAIEDSKEKLGALDQVTNDETPPKPPAEPAGEEPAPVPEPPAEPAPEGGESAPEGGEEPSAEPAPELPAEPAPEGGEPDGDENGGEIPAGEETHEEPDGDENAAGEEPKGDEESSEMDIDLDKKEIKKLIGKVANKVRETELTPDEVKADINSILAAYETKLVDVPEEDKKEMAERILKPEEEMGEETPEGEEAPEGEEVPAEPEEEIKECNECKFAKFSKDRGFGANELMECSLDEMSSLIAEFIAENDEEEFDNEIYENVATFMNEDVVKKLTSQYGFSNDTLEPFLQHVTKEKSIIEEERDKKFIDLSSKVKGMFWWDDDPGYSNAMNKDGQVPAKKTTIKEEIKTDPAATEVDVEKKEVGDDNDLEPLEEKDDKFVKETPKYNGGTPWWTDKPYSNAMSKEGHVEATKKEIGFAKPAAALSETKLRSYIRARIEENAGLRKKSLNESKKSEELKKLDSLIDSQYQILSKNYKKENLTESKLRTYIHTRIEEKLGLRKKSLNESKIYMSDKLKEIENMINNELGLRKKEIKKLLESKNQ